MIVDHRTSKCWIKCTWPNGTFEKVRRENRKNQIEDGEKCVEIDRKHRGKDIISSLLTICGYPNFP